MFRAFAAGTLAGALLGAWLGQILSTRMVKKSVEPASRKFRVRFTITVVFPFRDVTGKSIWKENGRERRIPVRNYQ